MNLFGSIARLVNVIWAKDGQPITLRPSQSVTYVATTDVQLPPSAATSQVLVSTAATQTLTNKTISGASNTITNVSLSTGVTGTLALGNGGTGQTTAVAAFDALAPTTTTGDTVYYNGTDNVRLPVGSTGQLLTVAGGIPAWASSFPGDKSFTSSSVLTLSSSTTTAGSRFSATNSDASRWLVSYSGGTSDIPAIWWTVGSDLQIGTSTAANGAGFSEKLRITSAGVVQVPNGVLVPTASAVGNVYSGTAASGTVDAFVGWTTSPTLNVPYHWTRVGNIVTVSGRIEGTTLPANTNGLAYLVLPVGSDFTASTDVWGVSNTDTEGLLMKGFFADAATNTAVLSIRNITGSAIAVSTVGFTYSYRVI